MPSDSELLRQYAEHGDEAAFAEIVRRQADLVYSVALRVAVDRHLAEDVTQRVFLKLAREAGKLSAYDTLVGWLHMAARHGAIDAVRGEERRRTREQEATMMQEDSSTAEPNWEQLRPVLDEAVEALPEDDRKAVLLRFFKNQSHQEIGAVFGLSEDTARKRVERALEKLRGYFANCGVTASSALLAAAISANSVQAAPAGLAPNVTRTSLASATGMGAAFLTLLHLMNTKSKAAVACLVFALVAAGFIFKYSARQTSAAPQVASTPAVSSAMNGPKQDATTPSAATETIPVQPMLPVVVVSAESAAPASVRDAQSDLDGTITEMTKQLQSGNVFEVFKKFVSPALMGRMTPEAVERMEARLEEALSSPYSRAQIDSMIQGLIALKTHEPTMSEDGNTATYQMQASRTNPSGAKTVGNVSIDFVRIDEKWYIASIPLDMLRIDGKWVIITRLGPDGMINPVRPNNL